MADEKQQSCTFRTTIGGQALIEGVMMRGPKKQAIVVRNQEGELVEKVSDIKFIRDRYPILGWPFVRGGAVFLGSMLNGVKALMYSAEFFPDEEEEPSKFEKWLESKISSKKLETIIIWLAMLMGVGLSVFLFMILPTYLTAGILHFAPSFPLWGRNVVEGVLKIIIFMCYLILCSKTKDIQRVFQYHAAEHKSIFCYEAGLPLTVENVRKQPCHHPRCGTSFLFVVICVSIILSAIVFGIWPMTAAWMRTLVHLALLPFVVGITYEINRMVGRHDNAFTRFLSAPGMWMQNFTTFEPEDDAIIEVGLRSLQLVLPEVDGEDTW
ncbi:DUF1385 domain-containing protein [Bengtsoniella intestinalis]|uniref:DUF1385 domain-containing protein n=1 Tax=Bengtsoniella intestinalis TaxID=3073143 RepID=UPI00391EEF85